MSSKFDKKIAKASALLEAMGVEKTDSVLLSLQRAASSSVTDGDSDFVMMRQVARSFIEQSEALKGFVAADGSLDFVKGQRKATAQAFVVEMLEACGGYDRAQDGAIVAAWTAKLLDGVKPASVMAQYINKQLNRPDGDLVSNSAQQARIDNLKGLMSESQQNGWMVITASVVEQTGSADVTEVNEGQTVRFTLTDLSKEPGEQVGYQLSGISADDITGANGLSGTVTFLSNGQATLDVTLKSDNKTEGQESLTLTVNGRSYTVVVNDTSISPSITYVLTTGQDDVVIETPDTVDTVKGVIDFDVTSFANGALTGPGLYEIGGVDKSTFNNGDAIEGNGKTRVELVIDITPDLFGQEIPWMEVGPVKAGYVEMSGVDELALKAASEAGAVEFDATSYGDDISKISLSGRDGMLVDVYNLQADDTLNVSLQTGGELVVTGEWASVDFSASLSNGKDSSNSSVNLTAAAVSVVAGNDADAYAYLGQESSGDGAIESVDGMTIGDLNLSAAEGGEVDAYFLAEADNTGSGAALVGDVTIGNIGVTLAKSATDTSLTVQMSADAADGAATVGNLVVGDVTVVGAEGADFSEINFYQLANADSGDAIVGNRTIGNIDISLAGDSGNHNTVSFSQFASASGEGDATIGDTLMGDITVNAEAVESQDVYIYAYADADTGNATVGDMVIGNVELNYGDGDDNHYFSVLASADVANEGDASVGNVTVGNITQTAGDDKYLFAYVWRSADTEDGNASVGDLVVGDVLQTVGDDATATFEASQSASAISGDATVGNLTIGDITSSAGDRGNVYGWIYQWGDVAGGALTMGDVTVGNVDMKAQVSGEAYFSVEQTGSAASADDTITIGKTTVGNVDLYAGANGEAGFGLYVTADAYDGRENTTVGDVMVGDLAITVENSADADFWNLIAAGALGDVTYGDINIKVGESASVNYFTIYASATTGDIGDFTVGDVNIELGASATMTGNWYTAGFAAYADGSIGDVTIGDQTITVATDADFGDNYDFEHHFSAANGDIGDVNMGDIVFAGNGDDADIDLDTYFWADDNIKSITMGVVSASADGEDSDVSIETDISASGSIGEISVGDLTASAIGEDADANVDFDIWADDDIDDVTFGDVIVRAENGQAATVAWGDASATVSISISASDDLGNVRVGDVGVTAIGEGADADFTLLVGHDGYLEDIGTVTIGDLTLMASGSDADAGVSISVDSSTGRMGLVEVGDINITVANTEEAGAQSYDYSYYGTNEYINDASAKVDVVIYVEGGGDLKVGNISLVQGDMTGWGPNDGEGYWDYVYDSDGDIIGEDYVVTGEWSNADMYAYVDLSSHSGDLEIGDITVTGGYKTAEGDVNDNYEYVGNDFTGDDWLQVYADGTITVGDIDYSGYKRKAYIDVSEWLGAANITAAQDDTRITDNKGKNTITLGAGNDEVILINENTGKATADVVDVIVGFNGAADTIYLQFEWDDFAVKTVDAGSYAAFLADAETADKDIYAGKVGSDYYVAFDKDDGNTVDFVVKLAGVSSVSESFFDSWTV